MPHARPALDCLDFSVESEGRKYVYSGDASLCDALTALCAGADLLLHWCYRLDGEGAYPAMQALMPTPSEIGRMAKSVGGCGLLLTHIRVRADALEARASTLAALAKSFVPLSGIAEDLAAIDICVLFARHAWIAVCQIQTV
ncbi:MBL fold metallo-hydrolase [Sulfitobacter sp.]|uniref:MBL fold metallo-hydrolase n=1 Tax=Sulfitobacter sp. TaxID=1903071 RepID=UPI0030035D5E